MSSGTDFMLQMLAFLQKKLGSNAGMARLGFLHRHCIKHKKFM